MTCAARLIPLLIAAMAGALAAGCAVDQSEEVATYHEVIALAPPLDDEANRPLTLRQALLLANRNNETLAIEGEDYLRALIERRRTVANFLPTVDLVGTHARAERIDGEDADVTDIAAELELNLFNGFRDVNAYWRDTFIIVQRRNDLLSFQETLLLDVARVYYEILRSEAAVRVLENSLNVQEERLRDTRGRLDAGVARPLDVAQTEAQVSATRTTLIDARRAVAEARQLLVLLTGAPALVAATLEDDYDPPAELEPVESFLNRSLEARRDLAAAAAAVTAARRDVEVAFGQYYPSVALNLTGFLYRESVPEARNWDGLLVASVPLSSAGRIRADVREAWSFVREALLVRSFLARQIEQQVRTAYLDVVASDARLAELRVQVTAAEQAFRQADASYRVGLATNLERVAAQDALLSAELQLASEEFDREIFYLDLLRAAGLLREMLEAATDAPGASEPLDASMDE